LLKYRQHVAAVIYWDRLQLVIKNAPSIPKKLYLILAAVNKSLRNNNS